MIPIPEEIVEVGLNRLTSQFQDKEKLNKILEIYLEGIKEVDSEFEYLLNERGVFVAVGDRLNQIGDLVGEERLGRGDEEYREAILARITVNNGEATPNDVLLALKFLTGADKVNIWEHWPACIYLMSDGDVSQNTLRYVKDTCPAGVNATRLIHNEFGECYIPLEVVALSDGTHFTADVSKWLPEYNEEPELVFGDVETSLLEINSNFEVSNMTITEQTNTGRMLLSQRDSYFKSQGILPEVYSI